MNPDILFPDAPAISRIALSGSTFGREIAEKDASALEDDEVQVSTCTGHPRSHLVLAWALYFPGVASVLIGGRPPAQSDQAFAARVFDESTGFAELETD